MFMLNITKNPQASKIFIKIKNIKLIFISVKTFASSNVEFLRDHVLYANSLVDKRKVQKLSIIELDPTLEFHLKVMWQAKASFGHFLRDP
jgi:hypothetical protein